MCVITLKYILVLNVITAVAPIINIIILTEWKMFEGHYKLKDLPLL